ncbi:MAG: ANTAR domain-containing protein [Candidatus Competibacteraceae bacterium]|jgi:response regulator NasT|nr:ANTAR domain-containing protein [Candidatus Competibacteraceae bacterium]
MSSFRVMLIDQSPGRSAILEQALNDNGYEVIVRVANGADIMSQVDEIKPDIILIDMESPDRDTLEHLRLLNRDQPKPIVMFAECSDDETITAAMRAGVSAYVVDEVNPKRLKSIMQVAIARFREFQALRHELDETKTRLAERKLVDKAKGLLMQHKSLSEQDAYQSLRKLAMDRNQRIGEVARNVIAVMELLA